MRWYAGLLAAAASLWAASAFAEESGEAERPAGGATPLIHLTDLYHPPCDPDDHWDLATVYALARSGRVRLLGVALDYSLPADPEADPATAPGDPGVVAVAQMNHIAGLSAPAVVGASVPYADVVSGKVPFAGADAAGAEFVIEKLRESPEPAVISVVGSCRTAALALWKDPEAFRTKCRAIYLNAGTARSDPARPEWNVGLDPEAYRALLEAPCPIYWLPCFEEPGRFETSRFGSYWRFEQGAILPELSKPVQNWLLYGLTRSAEPRWLEALGAEVDAEALAAQGAQMRNMWCTAGFLHMAGLGVSRAGKTGALVDLPKEVRLYDFEPIGVEMGAQITAEGEETSGETGRFVLEVKDVGAYGDGMREALRELLAGL